MNDNASLEFGMAGENCDKIKFGDNKNGLDRTSLQKSNVSKKLIIKNFGLYFRIFVLPFANMYRTPAKPQLPDDYLTQTWMKLDEAVVSIQNSKSTTTSLEELYQAVHNLCSQKMAAKIYEKLRILTESHVSNVVLQFLEPSSDHLTFLKLIER